MTGSSTVHPARLKYVTIPPTMKGTTMSKSVEKLNARIETLKAQLIKAEEALASASVAHEVVVGATVTFKYGRGDTAVIRSGVVLGSKVAENGVTQLACEIGEGFDKSVVRIAATAVLSVLSFDDFEAPAAE